MNISASGLFFSLVLGLLGTWLFLQYSERNHTDYRVHESRVACDKARFDAEFSPHSEDAKARAKSACGELDTQVSDRVAQEEKAKKENEQLKASIEKVMKNQEMPAEMTAAAASAVGAVVKAGKDELKK